MEEGGEIVCSVETWCSLVDKLTRDQCDALRDTGIYCMLQIPPVKMRHNLIRYLVEIYHPKTKRFVVHARVGEFTASTIDVECIYGLQNSGFCVADILDKEGHVFSSRIPPQFLSKTTKNLVINDLISKILQSGSTDDDFVRMTCLVLLGTVIAPQFSKIIPKNYYILVEDLGRFKELNLNEFTLRNLMESVRSVLNGTRMVQFPKGNVSLLQVQIIF